MTTQRGVILPHFLLPLDQSPLLLQDCGLLLICRTLHNDSSSYRVSTVVPLLDISCGMGLFITTYTTFIFGLVRFTFLLLTFIYGRICFGRFFFSMAFTLGSSSFDGFFRLFEFVSWFRPILTFLQVPIRRPN